MAVKSPILDPTSKPNVVTGSPERVKVRGGVVALPSKSPHMIGSGGEPLNWEQPPVQVVPSG
jgi:hypothetical protein